MPWCPKCKTEFREGVTVCSDCQAELVEELPVEDEEMSGEMRKEELQEEEEWAFLQTVEDDRELDVIESVLRSFDIITLRKYRWAGGYLKVVMGVSTFGVDLYVPESRLALAREVLEGDFEDVEQE